MKRFGKRVNRGLVLAAVILIGLIVFIQVDQYQFKSSKPEIEQMTRDYLGKVKQNNTMEPEECVKETKLLLTQYWGEKNGITMGITRNSMENYLEYVNADENGKLDEYIDRIESIEIKKNGPGAASVKVEYEVTLKGSERVSSYRIYGVETNWYGYGGTDTEDTSESRRYEITIQLAQKNDGWKITSIDSSYETVESTTEQQES